MQNQRVIKNDCDRTRVKDKPLLQSFREYLESLLTFYCKKNDIKYKQGMNEIVGPFILIKAKISISLTRIYKLFSNFILKYLTNYYHEDEFFSLQSSLGILNLLLKYHEPIIYNVLEFAIITPEMYATSWILTIFANKTRLGVLYHLWDILIREDDQLFIHFIVVSFLQYHRDDIIGTDHSQIPSVLSQLCLKSKEEVDSIYKMAKDLKWKTPYSFRLIARKLEIFKPNSKRLKELFNLFEPESMLAMPILPSEVFYIAYNNIVSCPDYICKNFKNLYDDQLNVDNVNIYCDKNVLEDDGNNCLNFNGRNICYFCEANRKMSLSSEEISNLTISNKTSKKKTLTPISYILLDLRISEEKSNDKHYDVKPGFLPMTVILDQKELNDENVKFYVNRCLKYNFSLLKI